MDSKNPEQAVPEDWVKLVNEQCDLDLAFEVLQNFNHFHTDTIRGRLRSYQLRPREAWGFFKKAEQRVNLFEKSKHNHLRVFYLKAYCFENSLIEKSDEDFNEVDQTEICLQNLFSYELPAYGIAEKIRTFCHGMYFIHKEDYISTKNLFEQLIRDSWDSSGDEKTGFYFAAAVANRGLGEIEKANRLLENACLCIPTLQSNFNMGTYSGVASSLLRLWNREKEAREWDEYLNTIKVPKKTACLFRERSRRILERSRALNRVFLF